MRYRKVLIYMWLLIPLLLAGCPPPAPTPTSVPPTTGQLLGEHSRVWHEAAGGSAREVQPNHTVKAGAGDEIWTENQGQALLKFVDLWIRLYGDSNLSAHDVTPASLRATLGQGSALVGETPGVNERVEITVGDPPHAVITLEGTLVMVAYVPDKRIALVRCFAGVVTVTSSITGKSQQIRPSEWGIVWDSNDVERTGDDDMIRDLTRELGLWDRFSVVEQDASNFGPSGARLSAGNIPQIFGSQAPAECPPPEVGLKLASQSGNQIMVFGQAAGGCPEAGVQVVTFDWGDGNGDELSLDGSQKQSFRFQHKYAQPGEYLVVVTAYDALDQTGKGELTVTIAGSTQPVASNLRARIISAPEKANCGQDLGDSVQIEVANTSDADAGPFFVGLYLSKDPEGSSRELLKGGREYVDGLAGGDTLLVPMSGSNQIPNTVPEGTNDYWLVAVADDTNQIEESNENDNVGTWSISISCLK